MNWSDIIIALERYTAENIGSDVELRPENVKYSSTPGIPFVTMEHIPVDTAPLTIGRTGVMDTEGILYLGLNYPSGEGSGAAFSKADALAMFFMPGQSLVAGSGNIVISKATLGNKQPSSLADRFTIPLVVYYKAFHNY